MISSERLNAIASVRIERDSGADLVEVRGVVPDSTGVLILDRYAPYLHSYSEAGQALAARGSKGRGPGEMEMPWGVARIGRTVYVSDGNRLAAFRSPQLVEERRLHLPRNSVAILPACGGKLTIVFSARIPGEDPYRLGTFGVMTLGDSIWNDPSSLQPSASPFTPTGPDFRGVALGDTAVAVFNHLRRRIDILSCSGQPPHHVDVPSTELGPHETPRPRGIALVDGYVVAFWIRLRPSDFDGTHVTILDVRNGATTERRLDADFRLHGNDGRVVWLAHPETDASRVFSVRARDFLRLLGVRE